MGTRRKYTRELLAPAVKANISVAGVMREMGVKQWSGGTHNLLVERIKEYRLDTSHFLGQASNRGKSHVGGPDKKHWKEVLVLRKQDLQREKTLRLRRAMIESGKPHQCAMCSLPPVWKGKPLMLPIDHKNGNNWDNRKRNVRFLCPNCHSQTETFGRAKKRGSAGTR